MLLKRPAIAGFEIGMPVEMVTRKLRTDGDERGLLVYGYKFRPAMLMPVAAAD